MHTHAPTHTHTHTHTQKSTNTYTQTPAQLHVHAHTWPAAAAGASTRRLVWITPHSVLFAPVPTLKHQETPLNTNSILILWGSIIRISSAQASHSRIDEARVACGAQLPRRRAVLAAVARAALAPSPGRVACVAGSTSAAADSACHVRRGCKHERVYVCMCVCVACMHARARSPRTLAEALLVDREHVTALCAYTNACECSDTQPNAESHPVQPRTRIM